MTEPTKKGFAKLSPERRSEIARLGGRSVPPHLRGFARDPAKAKAAARLSALKRFAAKPIVDTGDVK